MINPPAAIPWSWRLAERAALPPLALVVGIALAWLAAALVERALGLALD